MATHSAHLPSVHEYLQRERQAEFRSEYFAGEIFAMSGGTGRHAELSARLITLLAQGTCHVYDSNLKIYLRREDHCVYPDAAAVCGEPEFLDARMDVLLNPILVVEVLSPSTERYDKGSKALHYRGLPSLSYCLLVSQDRVFVECSIRQNEQSWNVEAHDKREAAIALPLLGLQISLENVYRGILV